MTGGAFAVRPPHSKEGAVNKKFSQVTAAAEMLARQLPTLEGHPVPFNVAKPLAALGLVVDDKPLPLLKGDWEEADGR
jgi:hypothetical protein